MLTKTKKIALLTTGLAGTLLATTIGGIALSSCTYNVTNGSNTSDPDKNAYTTKIDWSNLEDVGKRLNIDENGLVYSDVNRTVLIGSVPGLSVSELVIPNTVKEISGYVDITPTDSGITGSQGNTNTTQKGAFEGQTNLTSIKFQGQTQIINNNAFKGCTSLIDVDLPSSIIGIGTSAFENTGSISKINLNNVKYISNSAFKNAFTNLPEKTVDISLDNAQYIGSMAFMGNTAIKSLNFSNNNSLNTLSTSAFENTIIPGVVDLSKTTLKTIGTKAFKGTTQLETVKLPSSLAVLGATGADSGVFQDSSISSIDLSKTSISIIYQDTFKGAANLSTYSFPESLVTLDLSAFNGTAITSLDLSNTKVTTLNNNAFQNAANLKEVKFPSTLTTLGTSSFAGTSLVNVDLSNTQLTTISDSAFMGISTLTSVQLPSTLTTINQNAFKDTAISSIDLSNTKVKSIGNSAFENTLLSNIKFPNGTSIVDANNNPVISTIGTAAFKNTKLTNIDLRHVNLSTLSNSIFEDCSELEYILIKSPDLNSLSSPTTATAIQKQITSVGSKAFKNAKKLKGIFHVTEGSTDDQWTPNGIIVASPYLTSIGDEAFYNVPEIRVFDASNVINPSNAGNFIPTRVFAKDDATAESSQLEAIILPKILESSNQNFFVQDGAFSNNPKLTSVGTKTTLKFEETQAPTRADDYISKIKNPGFIAPAKLNAIGQYSFQNTGIEVLDLSQLIRFSTSNGGLGSSTIADGSYGYKSFANTLKLKKVILPKWLDRMTNAMFENTPALEEVNFNELTELNSMGGGNFTTLQNFKSSSITSTPSTSKNYKAAKADIILDLSNTKLPSLTTNSFTNLPSTLKEVKLPTTMNASFATTANVLTTTTTTGDTVTTQKVPLSKIQFINTDGSNGSLDKFENLMIDSTNHNTINPALFTDPNMDLSMFKDLAIISGGTFNNVALTSLKLPAKATQFKITTASGEGATLNTNYTTAAFNGQNQLASIEFSGFGVNAGNFDGSDIEPFEVANWDSNIKTNTQLWSTITTMMNSLGYDETLDNAPSPNLGVQGKWVAPTDANSVGSKDWMDKDLNTDGSDLIDSSGTNNKWWSKKEDAGSTSTNADSKLEANLSSTANTPKSVYFKHNNIIWTWTQTLANSKISITLTPDASTLPNVYKAVKDNDNAYITTFRTQKYTATTSKATTTSSYGLNFKFNIATKTTK